MTRRSAPSAVTTSAGGLPPMPPAEVPDPPAPVRPGGPPGAGVRLHLVPVSAEVVRDCVTRWHRHNGATFFGEILRVGAATEDGTLVAVGVAGRPVARHYADGSTLEVWRVSSDGTANSTSMLYGALQRAAFALGYTRIITYTQADESGSSLRAVGWRVIAQRKARPGWSSVARPRDDARYLTSARTLWEATP